jgi:putative cell wall-binding protein
VVYVVKGTDYPDALSAAPAAAFEGGPLLLTLPNELPAVTAAEITRLGPSKIVVVGGTASVNPAVFSALSALVTGGGSIERISGADRYEASRNLVEYAFLTNNGGIGVNRVYVSTGSNFPDALSASASAGAFGDAVLLVPGGSQHLDTPTSDLIDQLTPYDAVVAGGPNSVAETIVDDLKAKNLAGGAFRVSGTDRFDASAKIVEEGFLGAPEVFIATGLKFPDALAGAALAGLRGAPLFVVPSNCVPAAVLRDIHGYRASNVTLLGGEASLNANVFSLTSC